MQFRLKIFDFIQWDLKLIFHLYRMIFMDASFVQNLDNLEKHCYGYDWRTDELTVEGSIFMKVKECNTGLIGWETD